MELGLTFPLQRHLKYKALYGSEPDRRRCWDAHVITLQGRQSLLLVHCATRYTLVLWDMTRADWASLGETAVREIGLGLVEAGLPRQQAEAYLQAAGPVALTRTHGRREVAYLNRAWEDVMAADCLVDKACQRQPLLNQAVNDARCHCAGCEGWGTAREFLLRGFAEKRAGIS